MGLSGQLFNVRHMYVVEHSLTFRGGVVRTWFRSIPLPVCDFFGPSFTYIFRQLVVKESQLLSVNLGLDKSIQVLLLDERTCELMREGTS